MQQLVARRVAQLLDGVAPLLRVVLDELVCNYKSLQLARKVTNCQVVVAENDRPEADITALEEDTPHKNEASL